MRNLLSIALVLILVSACCAGAVVQEKKEETKAKKSAGKKGSRKESSKPSAEKSSNEKEHKVTSPASDPQEHDPASRLTKGSIWRGDRWHGKDPNGMEVQASNDVKVTLREGNQVRLTADKWAGAQGKVHWAFTINGKQLTCTSVSFTGGGPRGTFEEIKGSGTIEGDVLKFECSARQRSPKYNGPVYEKLVVKRAP